MSRCDHVSSGPRAIPPVSELRKLDMRYSVLGLLLTSAALGGCSGGVLDPKGPIASAGRLDMIVWSIPTMTVLLVGGVAWVGAHDLDPRRPIISAVKPVTVQVVSLD